MSSNGSSLFSDLRGKDLAEVERMYQDALTDLATTEEKLVDLYQNKKLHSEAIKFAVSKSSTPPKPRDGSTNELVELAVEQKETFAACIERRDALVERLSVPRHRVVHAMSEFHEKLTAPRSPTASLSLANEMEYFSRFFELQAMLEIYDEERDLQSKLHRARANLLETVKAVNKNDRRLAQRINQHRSTAKKRRMEAGRLKAFLEKSNASAVAPVPEPSPEMNQRLLAGEALTMEEFASMLEHGGLTDLDNTTAAPSKPKTRKKQATRSAKPRRGQRQTSPRRRD